MALIGRHDNETTEADVERLAPVVLELQRVRVGVLDVQLLLSLGLRPKDFEDLVVPISDVSRVYASGSVFLGPSPAVAGNSPRLVGTCATLLPGNLEYTVLTIVLTQAFG